MDHSSLKDPEDWIAFSQPQHGSVPGLSGLWESHVGVRGMHCTACSVKVEQILLGIKGVLSAKVSAVTGRASVIWSDQLTSPSEWFAATLNSGYELSPNFNGVSSSQQQAQNRLALWRWLVAGFCMMQVMMYAVPAYLAEPTDITPELTQLLRWASWILSLPVIAFSCGPFFKNAFRDLRKRSISMDLPVALGIAITFAISSAATFEPRQWWGDAVYFDSLTMFVFFLLTGRLLEQRLKHRADLVLNSLTQALPTTASKKLPDGTFKTVPIHKLLIGDIVKVLPGDTFPVDGTVVLGTSAADEALITGESRLIAKLVGDHVIAGSHNTTSVIDLRTEKLGRDTIYAQIVALIEQTAVEKPRLAMIADRIAKPFLIFVLLAALFAVGFWWNTDPAKAIMAGVAVLIVTCPCALSLATPVAMLNTASAFAKRGILVRRLQAIEALAEIDTVVFDKTGTLTETSLTLELGAIHCKDGISAERALLLAAYLAQHSRHPISVALVTAMSTANGFRCTEPLEPFERLEPLASSNIKEHPSKGVESTQLTDLFPEFAGVIRLGSAEFCKVAAATSPPPSETPQAFLSDTNGLIARFNFNETVRSDAKQVIQWLVKQSIAVGILSGDSEAAVTRIANQLEVFNAYGECSPTEKLSHVLRLQAQAKKVLMIGDGMNDGPVLAAAHVSIALGHAVQIAQAKSDFILPASQLRYLPELIQKSKKTMSIVRQNLLWAGAYNAICIPLAISGMLPAWLAGFGMAASSLLVVMNSARLTYQPTPDQI
jgi:P-type Cu2+ transporter